MQIKPLHYIVHGWDAMLLAKIVSVPFDVFSVYFFIVKSTLQKHCSSLKKEFWNYDAQ